MTFENTAVVAIDMQKGILKLAAKKAVPHTVEELVASNEAVIKAALASSAPVILITVSKHYFPRGFAKRFKTLAFSEEILGSHGICEFTKYEPSAYSVSSFREYLEANQVKTIILTGVATSNGVLKTARDLVEHGYKVITVEDATDDMSLERHNKAITELKQLGEVVQSTDL
ncbi:MAG: cysteine hydrolase [Lactobacillales bacterium]|nr:cysteine hydrolase [Lactobacillales bacterium]